MKRYNIEETSKIICMCCIIVGLVKNIYNFIGSIVYLYNCRAHHVLVKIFSLVGFIELLDLII